MNEGLLTEYVQTKSYYEALLEVHSVRGAPEYPPRWSSFDADNTWYEMLVHDWPGHGSELALDISRFRLIPPSSSVLAAPVGSPGRARPTARRRRLEISTTVDHVAPWCVTPARRIVSRFLRSASP